MSAERWLITGSRVIVQRIDYEADIGGSIGMLSRSSTGLLSLIELNKYMAELLLCDWLL